MKFSCRHTWEDEAEDIWHGQIKEFIQYEGYCEFKIESRSSIHLIIGKYTMGYFAVSPAIGGTYLSFRLDDIFFNTERLAIVFDNFVDGLTAATAIAVVAKVIKF